MKDVVLAAQVKAKQGGKGLAKWFGVVSAGHHVAIIFPLLRLAHHPACECIAFKESL